jgi:predicted alpha-1,2-mannosidase
VTKSIDGKFIAASRRAFLKASGLAAIGSALPSQPAEASPTASEKNQSAANPPNSKVELVNILQGTNSTPEFSRGNTLPIAALPFGMAHWTLQSNARSPWMFHPDARRIQGFRCTHQLSPWLSDYGYATFLPIRGEVQPEAGQRASSYNPDDDALSPHSLQLFLLRYRAHVELVPTERCCVLTATFEDSSPIQTPGLIFEVPGKTNSIEPDADKQTIRFKSSANAGGVLENFATYYVLTFPEPWESIDLKQTTNSSIGTVHFKAGKTIEARIATSFISFEQAEINLKNEVGSASPAALRDKAAASWNEHLNRIEIEGATTDQQRTFYSCMYRALLFPRTFHEPDAQGQMHHYSAFNGKVVPGLMYADHGYWDVYRAWYPLMSILFPERLGEILQAWVNAYKEGGWLPQFPSPGYRACMTGSLIDSVFGDAAAKKIPGFNLSDAYEALSKHAMNPGDPSKGYGRVGFEQYQKYHYVPADLIEQSAAETVDAAYGDFCIAQVAKALDKQQDYATLMKRSENWRNLYDKDAKFFRGKNKDGSWLTPFDPYTWGSPYVEGGAWQHRWDAPHDIPGMIEAIGGKTTAAAALDKMLSVPPIFNLGVYGAEIHEMSEMAAVPFGQYAHSNQPSHHLLYLFAHAGRPDRTQFWARRVMNELYTPDTFAGDEDTGSMASWYILSSLGFYPTCPGKTEYTLGSPMFTKATIHLPGQKKFIVEAPGNRADTVYVRSISLNGQPHKEPVLQHSQIIEGGTMRCEMSTTA